MAPRVRVENSSATSERRAPRLSASVFMSVCDSVQGRVCVYVRMCKSVVRECELCMRACVSVHVCEHV